MIYKFSVHRTEGSSVLAHLQRLLPDLTTWRDLYVQAERPLTDAEVATLASTFAEPLTERVDVGTPLAAGQVQVAYKRGIVDNENDSIVALCTLLGVPVVAARVALAYASADERLAEVIDAEACNPNIEELHRTEPHYDNLLPQGSYAPMEVVDLRALDDEGLLAVGRAGGRSLELDKVRQIRDLQVALGLDVVSDALLEALDARWSDHCAHTTWKSLGNLLGRLVASSEAAANPNVISMFHDNAGIWDFYEGYGIAVKAETHNGPSAVSAYFGQLTKLGGVLRDILGTGLGADPIGSFEYTATGLPSSPSPIAGRPSPRRIANETIRAIKEYGNTFGVPMMWSHMTFHDGYRAKPFALGGSIGIIPNAHAQKGTPKAGDHVLLIGALTGNDGIHGATGSSAGAVMDTTSVQIGSPLEEIKFREAILHLRDAGCIRAITDMGAAGINSAAGEMGEGVGIWLNTALVPLKTGGLPMWRILLSESQERMLLAIPTEKLTEAREVLRRYEVRNAVIGRFTGTDRYCVVHDTSLTEDVVVAADATAMPAAAEVGFDVPYELLKYRPAPREVPSARQEREVASRWPQLQPKELADVVRGMVGDLEVADQSFAAQQYDSSVQGVTHYGPMSPNGRVATGFYAGRPLYGKPYGYVFSTSFNPWLFAAHPVRAARQHFLSILAGQVLAGVELTDICLCDNFYTPHLDPMGESWLVGMVHELADLAERFRTPFISGKDSSAGSTVTDEGTISVPPGVFLSALGKVPDVGQVRSEVWTTPGNLLVRVGLLTGSLAGTVAARVLGSEANDVDAVDLDDATSFLRELGRLSLDLAPSGRLIGVGGIIGAAMLGSLASGLGAQLDVPLDGAQELLQEHRVAALIEVAAADVASLPADLRPMVVGHIVADGPSVRVGEVELLTDEAIGTWESSYAEELA